MTSCTHMGKLGLPPARPSARPPARPPVRPSVPWGPVGGPWVARGGPWEPVGAVGARGWSVRPSVRV